MEYYLSPAILKLSQAYCPFLENIKTRLSDGTIVLTGQKVQHHQLGTLFEFHQK